MHVSGSNPAGFRLDLFINANRCASPNWTYFCFLSQQNSGENPPSLPVVSTFQAWWHWFIVMSSLFSQCLDNVQQLWTFTVMLTLGVNGWPSESFSGCFLLRDISRDHVVVGKNKFCTGFYGQSGHAIANLFAPQTSEHICCIRTLLFVTFWSIFNI